MNNMMTYKGFSGSVEHSLDDMVLHGKIECIQDLVTYEAESLPALVQAFHEAVDDYLESCISIGKKPDKPMSGSFNVRIGADLHTKAYLQARNNNISLNDFVKKAIEEKTANSKEIHFHFENKDEITSGTYSNKSALRNWIKGDTEKWTQH